MDLRLFPLRCILLQGEDIGEVLVDSGSSDNSDSWHGVDDGVVSKACDRDVVDGGMEGAERDRLVEERLGVIGELGACPS